MKITQKGFAPVVLLVIIAVIVIGAGAYYYFQNKSAKDNNVNGDAVYKISDSLNEVKLLNDLIASRNRFGLCINEVANVYKLKQGRVLSQDTIAKAGQCVAKVAKKNSRAGDGEYIVTYSQELPEACKSPRTLSDLLKVQVNINTSQTKAEWQSGIKLTQARIDDIEASLKPANCKAYAEFIRSHGALH